MRKVLLLIPLMFPFCVMASNMQLHGTLIAPPCTISDGQTIDVPFGNNLGVNKIDGVSFKQPVKYNVNCKAGYAVNSLAIVVETTTPTAFDASAVQTDKNGLGIHILVDGNDVTFAKRVAVSDPASPPVIEAVPVQDPAVTLTEGAFEATMTLRTDYI
ncbi:fimbrial protein [Enterobacter asburiae]|uniref:fimbrial protein n=1 Tax=Enterobacter asburiae TaxID=61645 RepID=UPI0034E2B7F9